MSDPKRVENVVNALSALHVIAEAVVGYRRKLIDGGVSASSVEAMTLEFHTYLIEISKRQAQTQEGMSVIDRLSKLRHAQ